MKIDKEEFSVWRDHPVTERFFAYLQEYAGQSEQEWIAKTLESNMSGQDMELFRVELATRRNLIEEILETDEEDLNADNSEHLGD